MREGDKLKAATRTLYYLGLLCLLLLPLPLSFALKGVVPGEELSENRELAEFPEISLSLASIREFPDAFTLFFTDHLPFKTPLVRLNGLLDYYVLKSSASDSVIVGEDGYLFYRGNQVNNEDPVGDYLGTNLFSEEELRLIADNLVSAEESLREKGTEFVLFLPPNKERAYYELMPDGFGEPNENCRLNQLTEYLRANTDIRVVTPLDKIREYHERFPEEALYFSYDTHWNRRGAYLAAAALMEELGGEMPPLETLDEEELPPISGDLAGQIGLKGLLTDAHTQPSGFTPAVTEFFPLTEGDGYEGGAWGAGVQLKNLLLVGDSFSELLYPYLGCYYLNSLSVNYYYYDIGYLYRVEPDVFVLEVVERYLENLERFSLISGIERDTE